MRLTRSIATFIAISTMAVGCGEPSSDTQPEPNNQTAQEPDELTIPLAPVAERDQSVLVGERTIVDGIATAQGEPTPVTMGLGGRYPTELTTRLESLYDMTMCEELDGDLQIVGVTGGGDSANLEVASNDTLVVTALSEGDAAFTVQARFEPTDEQRSLPCWDSEAAYDVMQVSFQVPVTVRRPAGVTVDVPTTCSADDPAFLAGSTLERGEVWPVDDSGAAFYPSNALDEKPVTVTLSTPEGGELELAEPDGGFSDVELPEVAGPLDVSTADEEPLVIDVVARDLVREVTFQFQLPGLSDGPRALYSGRVYGEYFTNSRGDRIMPTVFEPLYAGEVTEEKQALCSAIPLDAFELTSETPEVCTVENLTLDQYESKVISVEGTHVGASAKLVQNGECQVTLRSESLGPSSAIGGLTAEFSNIDQLHQMTPETDTSSP